MQGDNADDTTAYGNTPITKTRLGISASPSAAATADLAGSPGSATLTDNISQISPNPTADPGITEASSGICYGCEDDTNVEPCYGTNSDLIDLMNQVFSDEELMMDGNITAEMCNQFDREQLEGDENDNYLMNFESFEGCLNWESSDTDSQQ